MGQETQYRREIVSEYRRQIEPLLKYISWLEEKEGRKASNFYDGEGIKGNSVPVPVYDGTLLSFIKEAQKTSWMDRNYVYVYSHNRIRTVSDEKRLIEKATIKEMNILTGILSKYVMGGMTKARLWSEAVEEGIFLSIILKIKEIIEFWDKPIEIE